MGLPPFLAGMTAAPVKGSVEPCGSASVKPAFGLRLRQGERLHLMLGLELVSPRTTACLRHRVRPEALTVLWTTFVPSGGVNSNSLLVDARVRHAREAGRERRAGRALGEDLDAQRYERLAVDGHLHRAQRRVRRGGSHGEDVRLLTGHVLLTAHGHRRPSGRASAARARSARSGRGSRPKAPTTDSGHPAPAGQRVLGRRVRGRGVRPDGAVGRRHDQVSALTLRLETHLAVLQPDAALAALQERRDAGRRRARRPG